MPLVVIEQSQSGWSPPVILVVKPCNVHLNPRKVNSAKVNDAYLSSLIGRGREIFSRTPEARFMTSLNLEDAF